MQNFQENPYFVEVCLFCEQLTIKNNNLFMTRFFKCNSNIRGERIGTLHFSAQRPTEPREAKPGCCPFSTTPAYMVQKRKTGEKKSQ